MTPTLPGRSIEVTISRLYSKNNNIGIKDRLHLLGSPTKNKCRDSLYFSPENTMMQDPERRRGLKLAQVEKIY